MKNITVSTMFAATLMAFGGNAMAQAMSHDQYKMQKDKVDTAFKSDKESCMSLSGNAKDICVEKAKAREKVGLAELEAAYKPTAKNRNEVAVTKAEGEYNVAIEVCDDKAGDVKDVCVKEAKAAKTRALADAKAQLTDTKAAAVANSKSAEAHSDAAADKADADFALAKEKCNSLAGNAKDACVSDAKAKFGK